MSRKGVFGHTYISSGRIAALTQRGDTKRRPPLQRSQMGGRPIEAGSRKALPGVLGVRFSGDTGSNHQGLFGLLRAAGANTPHMKAYHVWSRGTACLASYKVGFVLLAILLCLDLARLSKIGGGFFFLHFVFVLVPRCLSLLLFRAVHLRRDANPHHSSQLPPVGKHMRRRVETGCTVYTLL